MEDNQQDNKFPSSYQSGLPPSPTIENPGQVFPKSDPNKATPRTASRTGGEQFIGNPYLLNGALRKVDHALGEVIAILEMEESAHGGVVGEGTPLEMFREWREELTMIKAGQRTPGLKTPLRSPPTTTPGRSSSPEQQGGMFVD